MSVWAGPRRSTAVTRELVLALYGLPAMSLVGEGWAGPWGA